MNRSEPENQNEPNDQPSCFRLLLSNVHSYLCSRRDEQEPERRPLVPPGTILRAPRRRSVPHLSPISSTRAPGTSLHLPSSSPSPVKTAGLSRVNESDEHRREEGKKKMDSISKAFAGRMYSLNPNNSLPSSPSTTGPPYRQRPLSSIPTSQAGTTPHRPSAPHLGRSVSEPKSLHNLGGFAPHQVPGGSLTVDRGRAQSGKGRMGRMRSATVGARLASQQMDDEEFETESVEGEGRGRSRGVSSAPSFDAPRASAELEAYSPGPSSFSSVRAPSSSPSLDLSPDPPRSSSSRARPDFERARTFPEGSQEDQTVVRRELGLGALGSGNPGARGRGRGRGKGRKGRGAGGRVASH